jgi:hypothetical protein
MTTLNIKKQFELLKLLAKPKVRNEIIKNADVNLMMAICDVAHNTLEGRINISDKDKKKLAKYKKQLRTVCKASTLNHKKRYLKQQGGFLQFLIPAVVSGLSSIISSYIAKE